jgi:hypothetical protein
METRSRCGSISLLIAKMSNEINAHWQKSLWDGKVEWFQWDKIHLPAPLRAPQPTSAQEKQMISSGLLVALAASALEIPPANVATVLKALRANRLISVKGRGLNAATMAPIDAAALLTGISTGAVTAEIPTVSRMLLAMAQQHEIHSGPQTFRLSSDPLELLESGHTFGEGFAALLEQALQAYKDPDGEPLTQSQVTIGLNGSKTAGIATIEAISEGHRLKFFYSSFALREGISGCEDYSGIGLELFDAPSFMTATIIKGRALSEIAQGLAGRQQIVSSGSIR